MSPKISSYVIIRNHTIVRDGVVLFKSGGSKEDFLNTAYAEGKFEYPKFYKMDSLSKLGFLAAEFLLKDRTLLNEYKPEEVALIFSNHHSSLDTDVRYFEGAKIAASPALFVYTLPNIVAGEICIRHKFKGENAFFISEQFESKQLTEYVDLVFMNSSTRACIAGWVEVWDEHYDVFLYLVEKDRPSAHIHSAEQVEVFYKNTLWNN